MSENNIILNTDSYKIGGHWNMMLPNTEVDYAYYEARNGSLYDEVTFVGLQYILKKYLVGKVVTREKIEEARQLSKGHFSNENAFNIKGWEHILNNYDGKIPVTINAIPEGLSIPVSNALFTVESEKDKEISWLTGYLESLLSHVWYPTAIATSTKYIKDSLKPYFDSTSEFGSLDFFVHDFAYRSYTSEEAAEIGGLAVLSVNFLGTDTVPAIKAAHDYYNANYNEIAYSVPATQHSIMTPLGRSGEGSIVDMLLNKYPKGILSVVADSYDIYNFVTELVCKRFKNRILTRDGVFVVRPDSTTDTHPNKAQLVLWIVKEIYNLVGGYVNKKGYKVINNKIRVLYGDGLSRLQMIEILELLKSNGFSAENIATFGVGSGLIQKGIDRDVCRFAYKTSAQLIDGIWHDIYKSPLDQSKASKKGRLKVVRDDILKYKTIGIEKAGENVLTPVFKNGELLADYSLNDLRKNSRQ